MTPTMIIWITCFEGLLLLVLSCLDWHCCLVTMTTTGKVPHRSHQTSEEGSAENNPHTISPTRITYTSDELLRLRPPKCPGQLPSELLDAVNKINTSISRNDTLHSTIPIRITNRTIGCSRSCAGVNPSNIKQLTSHCHTNCHWV